MTLLRTRMRRRGPERGQALAEMGFVIVLFVFLTMGVIEFGRTLMLLNMITQAARDGARAGSTSRLRDSNDLLTNSSDIVNRVRTQMTNVMSSADASAFSITVTQPACGTTNNIPVVQVTVSGTLDYLFASFASLNVNRVATFRDEGRGC